MFKAILILKIPGNWIGELCTSCDLSVKVLRCVPVGDSRGKCLISVEGPPDMTGTALAEHILRVEPTCRIDLTETGPGRHIGTVFKCACALCSAVSESGCFLDSALSLPDGRIKWEIEGPSSRSIYALVDKVRFLGCEVEIENIFQPRRRSDLTPCQERVLRIAYEVGYFEIPKKITLDSLASKLDISKSTLDVMLRRAEKKIVEGYFDN